MKLNRKTQYALLFALYLARAGRATVEGASESLGLSFDFLQQVAVKLRKAGIVKSIRGVHGGYELVGEPRVFDVFNTITPVSLLSKEELSSYRKGPSETRSLCQYVDALATAWGPLLRRKIRSVGQDLVTTELARLRSPSLSSQVN